MGSRPLAQKNEAHVWLCWHFFFLGTTCVGFFHGWSPPSRFRYHRPRIASNDNQLGPVSWSIEHIVFVSYRIVSHRYSPSSACAINSQTLGPDPNMPNPQHDVSVSRFREPLRPKPPYHPKRHTSQQD